MKTALVLGATGLTGSHLVGILLKSPEYGNVIVFVRKELNIRNRKLTQYIIDFDNIDYYQDLIRSDDVFCCLGTTIKKAGSQVNFKKVDFCILPVLPNKTEHSISLRFLLSGRMQNQ